MKLPSETFSLQINQVCSSLLQTCNQRLCIYYYLFNYLIYIIFIGFIKKIDEIILNEIMVKYQDKFIPSSSQVIQNLDGIMSKLIKSNQNFVEDENFDLQWTCIVVDDDQKFDLVVNDEMKFIILSKATLQLCQNDDQRAYLLSNALAHFLLKHKREPVSWTFYISLAHLLFVTAILHQALSNYYWIEDFLLWRSFQVIL